MDLWGALETDVAAVMGMDGAEALITPINGAAVSVRGFWEGKNADGDLQGGPYFSCAVSDLPSTLPQGSTLNYPVHGGTTYTIANKAPDGHGLMVLTLTDETEL